MKAASGAATPVAFAALPETRASCWFRNDHEGTIHKARGRAGNDLIRFRQTLGDFQFRAEIGRRIDRPGRPYHPRRKFSSRNLSDCEVGLGADFHKFPTQRSVLL